MYLFSDRIPFEFEYVFFLFFHVSQVLLFRQSMHDERDDDGVVVHFHRFLLVVRVVDFVVRFVVVVAGFGFVVVAVRKTMRLLARQDWHDSSLRRRTSLRFLCKIVPWIRRRKFSAYVAFLVPSKRNPTLDTVRSHVFPDIPCTFPTLSCNTSFR